VLLAAWVSLTDAREAEKRNRRTSVPRRKEERRFMLKLLVPDPHVKKRLPVGEKGTNHQAHC
jgi:hypothetical protein